MDGRLRIRSVEYTEFEGRIAKKLTRILEASGGTRETPLKLHLKSLFRPKLETKQPSPRRISYRSETVDPKYWLLNRHA